MKVLPQRGSMFMEKYGPYYSTPARVECFDDSIFNEHVIPLGLR